MMIKRPPARWAAPSLLVALLTACGGGGGGNPVDSQPAANFTDPTEYSASAGGSLQTANEARAITQHRLTLNGTALDYTATAGHLTVPHITSGVAEASMFFVAYTLNGASAATRPVTFFYNGGPGSASLWLHIGSFGPRRLTTGVPGTSGPFNMVDNAESLLDVSDLVFVDAVGAGLSTAIAPFTNKSFWGVDVDAQVFRDFIARWLALNGRNASPHVLFGESYGTTRSAVLAEELEAAGVRVDGVVLQSSILDYNSNCDVFNPGVANCGGYLPSYAATAQFHGVVRPQQPADPLAFVAQAETFADTTYAPAVQKALDLKGLPDDSLYTTLADLTGSAPSLWRSNFSMSPERYRPALLAGQLIGRYDARMKAPNGSDLTRDGDPSLTAIEPNLLTAGGNYLRNELAFSFRSNYTSLATEANAQWVYQHESRFLPDTIPDLTAAMTLNPKLRVLSLNGHHDLATPFHQTRLDLARMGPQPRIAFHAVAGGHMTYLDDASRVQQKAALAEFYRAIGAAR